jgi:NADPH-dependent ferric siderophore reductase
MGIADSIARRFLNKALVISKEQIADNVFHLIIAGKALQNLAYIPGQQVRIFIGMDKKLGLREKIRTYSIWNYHSANGTMNLTICAHSGGPGSNWIKSVKAGEEIYLTAPQGNFLLNVHASEYLFIGDATTLAHFYAIRRNLPDTKIMRGIIYAEKKSQLFTDLDGLLPFEFYELPHNPIEQIKELIELKPPVNTADAIVYIGGDGRICVALNTYFRKFKSWKTKNIRIKPFWMPGKQGLE